MRRSLAPALLTLLTACSSFDGLSAEVPSPAPEAAASDMAAASTGAATTSDGATTKVPSTRAPAPAPSAPSCARPRGGATCGENGDGDCCATALQGEVRLGKYMITSGRMRTFVESVNGDVAGFVKTLPADRWKAEWGSESLPTDRPSADVALGPQGKKACEQGANTGHTFWTPPTEGDFSDFDPATLDDKALNCVPWTLAQALCAFDGGHLATVKDLRAAFTNGGTTLFPWGNDRIDPSAPDPSGRLNLEFGFVTETRPAKFRGEGHPSEVSFFIAPPGRFPAGDNQAGIADAAGNLLEWVGDAPRQFVWKGDFEHHAADAVALNTTALAGTSLWMDHEVGVLGLTGRPWVWGTRQLAGNAGSEGQKDGYYAIGARCAF